MSSRHIPDYYSNMMTLHREKMNCFLTLSKGTSREEQEAFEKADLKNEMNAAIKRREAHSH